MYFPLDFLLSWQKYNFDCEDVFLKRYLVSFLQRCNVPPRAVRALDLQLGCPDREFKSRLDRLLDLISVVPSSNPRPRLIRTPRYYGQFFCFVPRESPYIFSKFNPFYTDTPLSRPVFKFCFVPEESPNIFSKFDHLVITDSFFALSLGKALTFSLNSTRFIRTPVNTDNGHLHLAQSKDFHTESQKL